MKKQKSDPGIKLTAGRKLFLIFGIFILLYIIGTVLPLESTPHYYNRMSRVWNWTEILILLTAVYYIIKTKVFRWRQAVLSLLLGAVCLVSLFRDPRTADIIVTSVCVAAAFYAACRLFELAGVENVTLQAGVAGSIRSFGLGAAISIPLALLNVLYLSLSRHVNIGNLFRSAAFALKPAIAEEVIFRFFLLAFACHLLQGKPEKRSGNLLLYALLVLPHALLHVPDLFFKSLGMAVLMCILNSLLFSLPMALFMKKKNLQAAIGMHWLIDFVRFSSGF